MQIERFTITEDHLKLVQNAYVRWDDCEFGAPVIDCKRPYGNSYVVGDIAEILDWEIDEEGLTFEQKERATVLHYDLEMVLSICLQRLTFETGTYERCCGELKRISD